MGTPSEELDRAGLWRDEHSEAWPNLWWQPCDTGYDDHTGSCVGVHVIEGHARNEPLTIGEPPAAREYGPGETFWFPGEGIHRTDSPRTHLPGRRLFEDARRSGGKTVETLPRR
jgi:hypothetical protein